MILFDFFHEAAKFFEDDGANVINNIVSTFTVGEKARSPIGKTFVKADDQDYTPSDLTGDESSLFSECDLIADKEVISDTSVVDIDVYVREAAAILIQRMTRGLLIRTKYIHSEYEVFGEILHQNSSESEASDIDNSVVFEKDSFDDDFREFDNEDDTIVFEIDGGDSEFDEEEERDQLADLFDCVEIQVGDMANGSSRMDKISMRWMPRTVFPVVKKNVTLTDLNGVYDQEVREEIPNNSIREILKSFHKRDPVIRSMIKSLQQNESIEYDLDAVSDPTIREITTQLHEKGEGSIHISDSNIDFDLLFEESSQRARATSLPSDAQSKTNHSKTLHSIYMNLDGIPSYESDGESRESTMSHNTNSTNKKYKKWKLFNKKQDDRKKQKATNFGSFLSLSKTTSTMDNTSIGGWNSFYTKPSDNKQLFSKFMRKPHVKPKVMTISEIIAV
jgi:hypothetical protein